MKTQKIQRQALEAMLASDLFANTVALAVAGVCIIADDSQESIVDRFTDTLRLTICGSLFRVRDVERGSISLVSDFD